MKNHTVPAASAPTDPDTGFGVYMSNDTHTLVTYALATTGLLVLARGLRKLTKVTNK
jgi:hypothetical protein